MKKVNVVLIIISIIVIFLGIILGISVSNELINSISVENNVNSATTGAGANYSDIIELFGVFGSKIIGTIIILGSIFIDIFIWLSNGAIFFINKIIKNIKNKFK